MIIKNPLEDLQIRIAIINSNEDLKALSQVKTRINDMRIDLQDQIDKDEDPNYPDLDPCLRDEFDTMVEWLDESYSKLDKVFQKLLREVASKGENDGRTEK